MVDTNNTTNYSMPMYLVAIGIVISCISLYIFKKKTFAGLYPLGILISIGILSERNKMEKFHTLYSDNGGSKYVTMCFDFFVLISMISWAMLVFSLPQIIINPTKGLQHNILKHFRKKSLFIWFIPIGIFARFDNVKLLEINKGVIQVFWDPPLLFAGQFARACNHRMFGPFYSEIDDEVVVGSFPMAEDVEFMKSKNIVGVVNMCHEWAGPQSQYTNVGIEQLRLQTVDTISPTFEKLEKGIQFINNKLKSTVGSKVFIHCKGGIGRAATMGMAYYISKGMTIENAFNLLKSKRSIVNSKIKEYPPILLLEKKYSSSKKKKQLEKEEEVVVEEEKQSI